MKKCNDPKCSFCTTFCWFCSGSGEGRTEGSTCRNCGGSGVVEADTYSSEEETVVDATHEEVM